MVPRAGNMWAMWAVLGKIGKFNSTVCVAVSVSWFDNHTLMPFMVLCLFVYGAFTARK